MEFSVVIRDVRSFAGRHLIPVRPLTILLGENSTGKSTFLAIVSAMLDETTFPLRPNLNRPPYDLGSHDNVLNARRRIKNGQASDFALGMRRETAEGKIEMIATYRGRRGQIEMSALLLTGKQGQLALQSEAGTVSGELSLTEGGGTTEFKFRAPTVAQPVDLYSLVMMNIYRAATAESRHELRVDDSLQFRIFEFMRAAAVVDAPPFSVAPIRMKPKRTYDQTSDSFSPEGDHIPILLSRIYSEETSSKTREILIEALRQFGRESGLFNDVKLRRLGARPTDPFQIRIATGGYMANLADVGYGVSQSLPVVVQSVISGPGLLLLQQPEVHLHPKAQAALGTFFAGLVSSQQKRFIIETHSDYLVDRIRQEIAAGRLDASRVALLFFERREGSTKVSQIEIDRMGNLISPPRRYREFFLREQARLLARG